MLVGGEWVDARSGATFESINPFTAEPWATIPRAGAEDVDDAVRAARGAFESWSRTTPVARGRLLRRLAELIAVGALAPSAAMAHPCLSEVEASSTSLTLHTGGM